MEFLFPSKRLLYLETIKYLLTSIFVYIYILSAIYIAVDFLRIDKVLAYILIYITSYVIEYIITLSWVFSEQHHWIKIFKFIAYVSAFLGLSTIVFKFLLSYEVYYLFAVLLTAASLMPVRFVVNKYWVYR